MNPSEIPLVSVIIPFYNHNQFIGKTLDSILEDTYPNKEIIIINDGSSNPDDSNILKWISENEKYIRCRYIKRANLGPTKTMNELIGLAEGKYILPCASDDYFINNTISSRITILEKNPQKLLLIADSIVVNDDDKLLFSSNLFEMRKGRKENYKSDIKLKYEIIKRWGGAKWIANKQLFDVIGVFDETLTVEDWDFILRCVAKNLVLFFDQQVAAYRLHDNNTISNPEKIRRMALDRANTAKKNIQNFKSPYFKYLLWKTYKKTLKSIS